MDVEQEAEVWKEFLEHPVATGATEKELQYVRSRGPCRNREPTVMFYVALLLLYRGKLTTSEFSNNLDLNERLYESAKKKMAARKKLSNFSN